MASSSGDVEKAVENMSVKEDEIYTSESRGSDESGEGTFKVPYKTILQAMKRHGKEPFPVMYQDAKPESDAAKEGIEIKMPFPESRTYRQVSFLFS